MAKSSCLEGAAENCGALTLTDQWPKYWWKSEFQTTTWPRLECLSGAQKLVNKD